MGKTNKKTSEEIRCIFEEACTQQALLILTTQYLKFESRFVCLDDNEVHVRTTTGGEDALVILGAKDISLRFSHMLDFMEANTKLIGLGKHDGKKTIRLAMPSSIFSSEGRKISRITHLGDAYTTFYVRGRHLIRADMVDLSATGARLTIPEDLPRSELRVDDRIMLSIHMPEVASIQNSAIIRNIEDNTFGVEFSPDLNDSDMISISSWLLRKQERERELLASRTDLSTKFAMATAEMEDDQARGGILLVTLDDELDFSLGGLLGEDEKFYRILPDITSLKEVLSKMPHIVIFHLAEGVMIERLLLKSLAENIPSGLPVLLLGTGVTGELLFEVGQACRAVASVTWNPNRAVFLQRLVLGIFRKHYGQGESPMAPKESEQ